MGQKINIVFTGGFTYPKGMAATKRIQNIILWLKTKPEISCRVLLIRQLEIDNPSEGYFQETHYKTVMGNLSGLKMLPMLPILWYRTVAELKSTYRPDKKNILYFYGPLFLDSIIPLHFAKKQGYKIIFDVIEDFSLADDISLSRYQSLRTSAVNFFSLWIKSLASGIIVISSYLKKKCDYIFQEKAPLFHFLPVSVNMTQFPSTNYTQSPEVSLFYSGSFEKKDGLSVLLDAFDILAERHPSLNLILTGKGDDNAMSLFFHRLSQSPYKDRIHYKGFLNETRYYQILNKADIPCMTRVDLAFAHAGFPFKLGEFLATGKPVVASKVSDVERFLDNGKNALLVTPGSSAELVNAINRLIESPNLRQKLGSQGRVVAQRFFDYQVQGQELIRFLKAV